MTGVGDTYRDQEVKIKKCVHLSQMLAVINDLAWITDLSSGRLGYIPFSLEIRCYSRLR